MWSPVCGGQAGAAVDRRRASSAAHHDAGVTQFKHDCGGERPGGGDGDGRAGRASETAAARAMAGDGVADRAADALACKGDEGGLNGPGQQAERRSRHRLVTIDDLAERVQVLEAERSKLAMTVAELRGALEELVEACDAGGTGRYMLALGMARRLLDAQAANDEIQGA